MTDTPKYTTTWTEVEPYNVGDFLFLNGEFVGTVGRSTSTFAPDGDPDNTQTVEIIAPRSEKDTRPTRFYELGEEPIGSPLTEKDIEEIARFRYIAEATHKQHAEHAWDDVITDSMETLRRARRGQTEADIIRLRKAFHRIREQKRGEVATELSAQQDDEPVTREMSEARAAEAQLELAAANGEAPTKRSVHDALRDAHESATKARVAHAEKDPLYSVDELLEQLLEDLTEAQTLALHAVAPQSSDDVRALRHQIDQLREKLAQGHADFEAAKKAAQQRAAHQQRLIERSNENIEHLKQERERLQAQIPPKPTEDPSPHVAAQIKEAIKILPDGYKVVIDNGYSDLGPTMPSREQRAAEDEACHPTLKPTQYDTHKDVISRGEFYALIQKLGRSSAAVKIEVLKDLEKVYLSWQAERDMSEKLAKAIKFTHDYVGFETLPAIPGWSWYDALLDFHQHLTKYGDHGGSMGIFPIQPPAQSIGGDDGHGSSFQCPTCHDNSAVELDAIKHMLAAERLLLPGDSALESLRDYFRSKVTYPDPKVIAERLAAAQEKLQSKKKRDDLFSGPVPEGQIRTTTGYGTCQHALSTTCGVCERFGPAAEPPVDTIDADTDLNTLLRQAHATAGEAFHRLQGGGRWAEAAIPSLRAAIDRIQRAQTAATELLLEHYKGSAPGLRLHPDDDRDLQAADPDVKYSGDDEPSLSVSEKYRRLNSSFEQAAWEAYETPPADSGYAPRDRMVCALHEYFGLYHQELFTPDDVEDDEPDNQDAADGHEYELLALTGRESFLLDVLMARLRETITIAVHDPNRDEAKKSKKGVDPKDLQIDPNDADELIETIRDWKTPKPSDYVMPPGILTPDHPGLTPEGLAPFMQRVSEVEKQLKDFYEQWGRRWLPLIKKFEDHLENLDPVDESYELTTAEEQEAADVARATMRQVDRVIERLAKDAFTFLFPEDHYDDATVFWNHSNDDDIPEKGSAIVTRFREAAGGVYEEQLKYRGDTSTHRQNDTFAVLKKVLDQRYKRFEPSELDKKGYELFCEADDEGADKLDAPSKARRKKWWDGKQLLTNEAEWVRLQKTRGLYRAIAYSKLFVELGD